MGSQKIPVSAHYAPGIAPIKNPRINYTCNSFGADKDSLTRNRGEQPILKLVARVPQKPPYVPSIRLRSIYNFTQYSFSHGIRTPYNVPLQRRLVPFASSPRSLFRPLQGGCCAALLTRLDWLSNPISFPNN